MCVQENYTGVAVTVARICLFKKLYFALAFEDLKIFKDGILSSLINSMKKLQTKIPGDDQPEEIWSSFADRTEKTYLNAFQLQREWLELSEAEANDLTDYLYVCELMVRCKESAVRVSRETWEGIESRMLMPTKGQSVDGQG